MSGNKNRRQTVVPNRAKSVYGKKYQFRGVYWFERPHHARVDGQPVDEKDVRLSITFPDSARTGIYPQELVLRNGKNGGSGASYYYGHLDESVDLKIKEQGEDIQHLREVNARLVARIDKMHKQLELGVAKYLNVHPESNEQGHGLPSIFVDSVKKYLVTNEDHTWALASPPMLDADALAVNYTQGWFNVGLLTDMLDTLKKVDKFAARSADILLPKYQTLPLIVKANGFGSKYYLIAHRTFEPLERRKMELEHDSTDAALEKIRAKSESVLDADNGGRDQMVRLSEVEKILAEHKENRKARAKIAEAVKRQQSKNEMIEARTASKGKKSRHNSSRGARN